jgi:hypothetical protein
VALLSHVLLELLFLLHRVYLHFLQIFLTLFALLSLTLLLFLQFFNEVFSLLCSFALNAEIIEIETAGDHGAIGAGCSDGEAAFFFNGGG